MAAIHTPVNSSGKGPGKRNEIFYFDDSGNLNAFRHGDWKVSFAPKDSLAGWCRQVAHRSVGRQPSR
jgi:hypothetical protein